MMTEETGMVCYRAPEMCPSDGWQSYDERVDLWSAGCLLFKAATGLSPFGDEQTMSTVEKILTGKYDKQALVGSPLE